MAMPNVNHVTGESGYMKLGGTTLQVREWSSREEVGFDVDTDTSSGGWETSLPTIKSLTGSCTANLDVTNLPAGQTPALIAGQPIEPMLLYIGASDSAAYYSFKAWITGIAFQSAVAGTVTFSIDFRANGEVTRPT